MWLDYRATPAPVDVTQRPRCGHSNGGVPGKPRSPGLPVTSVGLRLLPARTLSAPGGVTVPGATQPVSPRSGKSTGLLLPPSAPSAHCGFHHAQCCRLFSFFKIYLF